MSMANVVEFRPKRTDVEIVVDFVNRHPSRTVSTNEFLACLRLESPKQGQTDRGALERAWTACIEASNAGLMESAGQGIWCKPGGPERKPIAERAKEATKTREGVSMFVLEYALENPGITSAKMYDDLHGILPNVSHNHFSAELGNRYRKGQLRRAHATTGQGFAYYPPDAVLPGEQPGAEAGHRQAERQRNLGITEKCLAYIAAYPNSNRREIAEAAQHDYPGITVNTLGGTLSHLVRRGLLDTAGDFRDTRYRIKGTPIDAKPQSPPALKPRDDGWRGRIPSTWKYVGINDKVLEFLAANPNSSGHDVVVGMRKIWPEINCRNVYNSIYALFNSDRIVCAGEKRKRLYSLKPAEPVERQPARNDQYDWTGFGEPKHKTLSDKLPDFNESWPDAVKTKWFEAFAAAASREKGTE